MIVGVLAFQGDFAEHIAVLHSLRMPSVEVRSVADLTKCDALIIPGGESTVMAKFLEDTGVGKEIVRKVVEGRKAAGQKGRKPAHSLLVYGTCAGAILLARKATGKNAPRTLGLIDIVIDRNAYGTQLDSFEASLSVAGIAKKIDAVFIRAPKITKVGNDVDILATYKADPVLLRQGSVTIGTFHPEVRGQGAIHRLALTLI